HSVNPAQGWLANWNNKPAEGWASTAAGFGDWGPVQRVRVLMDRASAIQPRTATLETLSQINRAAATTTGSPPGSAFPLPVATLKTGLLAAVDAGADPRLPATVAMLASW